MTIGHEPGLFLASLYTAEGFFLAFATASLSWYWKNSFANEATKLRNIDPEAAILIAEGESLKKTGKRLTDEEKQKIAENQKKAGPEGTKLLNDKELSQLFNHQYFAGTLALFGAASLAFGVSILCVYNGDYLGSLMIGWSVVMGAILFVILSEVGCLGRFLCCWYSKSEDRYWNVVANPVTARAISIGFLLYWVLQDLSVLAFLYDGVRDDANSVAFHTPPTNYTRTATQEHLIPGFHWFNRMILAVGVVIAGVGVLGMALYKITQPGFQFMVYFGYAMKIAFGVNLILMDAYANTKLGEETDRQDGFFGGIRMVVAAGVVLLVYSFLFMLNKTYFTHSTPGGFMGKVKSRIFDAKVYNKVGQ